MFILRGQAMKWRAKAVLRKAGRRKASTRQNRSKARNRDETLEQLAAASEILEAIGHSTFDLQTVLATLVKSAGRLCQAENVQIFLFDGEFYRLAADNGFSPAYQQYARDHPIRPGRDTLVARTALYMEPVQIPDALADPGYSYGGQKLGGYRTLLGVPLLRDKKCLGVIALTRSKVQPFTDRQIALVTNYAAQAVIAIENARLLQELRESLDQQTATSEVLKVIASSTGELAPVFSTMLANAARLCEASYGAMWLRDGDDWRAAAMHGDLPAAYLERWRSGNVFKIGPDVPMARVLATRQPVHVPDMREDAGYLAGDRLPVSAVEEAGIRTQFSVPMMRNEEVVGVITIYRREVRPFGSKQIELIQNFAAQAVIAIENARLLNELRQRTDDLTEALEHQTATSEVLNVISRSPTNARPVFDAICESASRLCEGAFSVVWRYDGDLLHYVASHNFTPQVLDRLLKAYPKRPDRSLAAGRAILDGGIAHVPDMLADPAYGHEFALAGNWRASIAVPMLLNGRPIGAISVGKAEAEPFTERQKQLLTTFADQAVIAIENVRLFEAEQERTRELAKSLNDLRTAQDRLVQTQKLASLGQLTAGIAHEIKNPLNFVNNFSGVSAELIDELQEALKAGNVDDKTREEVAELTDTLRGNLEKIVQHGRRADSIVKNMLLHSREGSGEHRPVDINALVEESLNLAYHGARAEKQGFNVALERSFDPRAGEADLYPQDITRVLLNLISNGFYATLKRKAEAANGDHEPVLAATTRDLGHEVEITIRDNGTGIPPEVKEKMFNPFFTTKPAGEGTGLGLSISHDIIVKQHAGTIEVESQPGEFTEIRIVLPRSPGFLGQSGGSST